MIEEYPWVSLVTVANQVVFPPEEFLNHLGTAEFFVGPVEEEALVEAGNLVNVLGDNPEIVGDQRNRQAFVAVELGKHVVEAGMRFGIHTGRGFVQKKNIGTIDNGPGNEDPLLLTPRKLPNPAVFQLLHVYLLQRPFDGGFVLMSYEAREAFSRKQAQGYDLADRRWKVRIQVGGFLGHIPDSLPLVELINFLPHQDNPSVGRL